MFVSKSDISGSPDGIVHSRVIYKCRTAGYGSGGRNVIRFLERWHNRRLNPVLICNVKP